jgi:hypothetical protein
MLSPGWEEMSSRVRTVLAVWRQREHGAGARKVFVRMSL